MRKGVISQAAAISSYIVIKQTLLLIIALASAENQLLWACNLYFIALEPDGEGHYYQTISIRPHLYL